MCTRHRIARVLVALLAAWLVACGDDTGDGAGDGAGETTDGEGSAAPADGADPCSLLSEDDLVSALEVSISEPEDVSGRISIGPPGVDSNACQWVATTTRDDVAVSRYSVELVTVVDGTASSIYTGLAENAGRFGAEVSEVDLGDEAVSVVDDGSPEILVRSGDVVIDLTTASDDLAVDDLRPLAEAVLARLDAA